MSDAERIQQFNLAVGPLLDLLELTGYVILASELRQSGEFWDFAKALWDGFLADAKNGVPRMQLIRAALETADVPAMFAPGELLRTGWRQRIHELVRMIPVVGIPSVPYGVSSNRVQHRSNLIRVLASSTLFGMYRGIDIFAVMYFVHLPGNQEFAQKLRSNDLNDALHRERQRWEREQGTGRDDEADG